VYRHDRNIAGPSLFDAYSNGSQVEVSRIENREIRGCSPLVNGAFQTPRVTCFERDGMTSCERELCAAVTQRVS